jgi:purine-binding chemotaxis protein CheW
MKTLVFSVAGKAYGADISQVREVVRMRKVTPVPDTAAFIAGVIYLRGKVIPVIDLGLKLGLGAASAKARRIIVTSIQEHRVGLVVDHVHGVVGLKAGEVNRPDEVLRSARYLLGVARSGGALVLVLDLAELLMGEEAESLQSVSRRVEVRKKEEP